MLAALDRRGLRPGGQGGDRGAGAVGAGAGAGAKATVSATSSLSQAGTVLSGSWNSDRKSRRRRGRRLCTSSSTRTQCGRPLRSDVGRPLSRRPGRSVGGSDDQLPLVDESTASADAAQGVKYGAAHDCPPGIRRDRPAGSCAAAESDASRSTDGRTLRQGPGGRCPCEHGSPPPLKRVASSAARPRSPPRERSSGERVGGWGRLAGSALRSKWS